MIFVMNMNDIISKDILVGVRMGSGEKMTLLLFPSEPPAKKLKGKDETKEIQKQKLLYA